MTTAQRIYFFSELWPEACAGQGWDAADRELRLKVVSEAVQRKIESIHDVEKKREFGLLKARCLTLAGNLAGAMEDGDPEPDERRRLLFVIGRLGCPPPYLKTLLRDRFGVESMEDLKTLREVRQLLYTLTARARGRFS